MTRLLLIVALLALGACTATGDATVECICGTPQGDLHGCHHPACVSGEGYAANPECICKPLKVVPEMESNS